MQTDLRFSLFFKFNLLYKDILSNKQTKFRLIKSECWYFIWSWHVILYSVPFYCFTFYCFSHISRNIFEILLNFDHQLLTRKLYQVSNQPNLKKKTPRQTNRFQLQLIECIFLTLIKWHLQNMVLKGSKEFHHRRYISLLSPKRTLTLSQSSHLHTLSASHTYSVLSHTLSLSYHTLSPITHSHIYHTHNYDL